MVSLGSRRQKVPSGRKGEARGKERQKNLCSRYIRSSERGQQKQQWKERKQESTNYTYQQGNSGKEVGSFASSRTSSRLDIRTTTTQRTNSLLDRSLRIKEPPTTRSTKWEPLTLAAAAAAAAANLLSLLPSSPLFFSVPVRHSLFPLWGWGGIWSGWGWGRFRTCFTTGWRKRERERERRGEFQLVHLEPSFLSFLSQSAFGSSREKEEKKRERERERERERRKAEKEESEAALAQHAIRITKYCFSPLEDFLCPVLSTPGREGKTLSPVQPSPTRRSRQPTCYGFFKRGWPASFTKVRSEDPSETRFKEPTQPNLCKGHVN